MKREYDTFVETLDELPQGKEVALAIRDLTPGPRKYDSSYVRAIVSSNPQDLPDGDTLWIRLQLGTKQTQPWAIKVLETLGEYMPKEAIGWRT